MAIGSIFLIYYYPYSWKITKRDENDIEGENISIIWLYCLHPLCSIALAIPHSGINFFYYYSKEFDFDWYLVTSLFGGALLFAKFMFWSVSFIGSIILTIIEAIVHGSAIGMYVVIVVRNKNKMK